MSADALLETPPSLRAKLSEALGQKGQGIFAFWYRITTTSSWATKSFMIFERESLVRKLAISLTHTARWSALVQVVILTNCVTMMLIDPLDPNAPINLFLANVETFFTIFFTAELLLNAIATCFVLPDPHCGRWTDVYSIQDLLKTRFGTAPPRRLTVGNLEATAAGMSTQRVRALLAPFYADDGAGGVYVMLEKIKTTLKAGEPLGWLAYDLGHAAGIYFPVKHDDRLITTCAMLHWLCDVHQAAVQRSEEAYNLSVLDALRAIVWGDEHRPSGGGATDTPRGEETGAVAAAGLTRRQLEEVWRMGRDEAHSRLEAKLHAYAKQVHREIFQATMAKEDSLVWKLGSYGHNFGRTSAPAIAYVCDAFLAILWLKPNEGAGPDVRACSIEPLCRPPWSRSRTSLTGAAHRRPRPPP